MGRSSIRPERKAAGARKKEGPGRRKRTFDPAAVEELAALGLGWRKICEALGCCMSTLADRLSGDEEFAAAFRRGRLRAEQELARTVREAALKEHDWRAAAWLLKVQHGWSEQTRVEVQADSRVQISGQLGVSSMSDAQLLALAGGGAAAMSDAALAAAAADAAAADTADAAAPSPDAEGAGGTEEAR